MMPHTAMQIGFLERKSWCDLKLCTLETEKKITHEKKYYQHLLNTCCVCSFISEFRHTFSQHTSYVVIIYIKTYSKKNIKIIGTTIELKLRYKIHCIEKINKNHQ